MFSGWPHNLSPALLVSAAYSGHLAAAAWPRPGGALLSAWHPALFLPSCPPGPVLSCICP
uniref:Uncharacterized protein n=1 Tax=Anguilla anguilla TaxID=7936 RepID=A0A0E9WZM1_ANGAN